MMNERQQQITDNHLNNRCEIVTSRDPNGRARSCRCVEQAQAAGQGRELEVPPTELTKAESLEVRRAFGHMAYAADACAYLPTYGEPMTTAHLLRALAALRTSVSYAATMSQEVLEERDELLQQRRAMRRFLGIES